jgi:hypothetical protein
MPQLTQLATSTKYFWQEVNATDAAGNPVDPTGDAVAIAFLVQPAYGPPPDPSDSDFHTAIWATGAGPTYWAGILIGPANGGLVLAKGAWVSVVRVTDNPEVPEDYGWGLNIV